MARASLNTSSKFRNVGFTIPGHHASTDLAAAIRRQYTGEPLRGPVFVELELLFSPPRNLTGAQRAECLAGRMSARAVNRRGGLNEAFQAAIEAGEGVLWKNAEQVAGSLVSMRWGEREEAAIRVVELPPVAVREAELPEGL